MPLYTSANLRYKTLIQSKPPCTPSNNLIFQMEISHLASLATKEREQFIEGNTILYAYTRKHKYKQAKFLQNNMFGSSKLIQEKDSRTRNSMWSNSCEVTYRRQHKQFGAEIGEESGLIHSIKTLHGSCLLAHFKLSKPSQFKTKCYTTTGAHTTIRKHKEGAPFLIDEIREGFLQEVMSELNSQKLVRVNNQQSPRGRVFHPGLATAHT